MKPFKSFDGEAVDGQYCLLACDDATLWRDRSLGTKECLDFLFDHGQTTTNVFYSFHYDVINILKDMNPVQIERLNTTNETFAFGYLIKYFPRKILSLTRDHRRITFYDVSGFFQKSFEKAVFDTLGVRDDAISKGKADRAAFRWTDKDFIIAYNARECDILTDLCNRLEEICRDFKIKSWHGASALATSVLTNIDFESTRATEAKVSNARYNFIDAGYYGGRIEALKIGFVPNCVSYDIVSAYPSAMRFISDITRFKKIRRFVPDTPALYKIRFYIPRRDIPMPFPVRTRNRILFPQGGETVVTGYELQAFYEHYLPHVPDATVKVIDGLMTEGETQPLRTEVERLFTTRAELKAQQDERQIAYKLALNSMYGKFAQKVGKPKFSVKFWAGQITGHCRAMMLEYAAVSPEFVVSFATDSITYQRNAALDVHAFDAGKKLGQLELAHSGDIRVLQSGLYKWSDGSEAKIRGFRGLDFEAAYASVNDKGYATHDAKFLVGFNPPRSMLHLRGQIITFPKILQLTSNRKRDYGFTSHRDMNTAHWDSLAWPTCELERVTYNQYRSLDSTGDALDLVEM